MDSAPASMMMIAMTIAKMGRLMKNLAMASSVRRRGNGSGLLDGANRRSGPHVLYAGHDDLVAVVQSSFDDPVAARCPGRLDRAPRDLVVALDHERRGVTRRVVGHADLRRKHDVVVHAFVDA